MSINLEGCSGAYEALFIDVKVWTEDFFDWYNNHHRHSSLGLMTTFMVQYGQAEHIREQRKQELMDAYNALKERFVRGISSPELLPEAVWINTPQTKKEETELLHYILTKSA